MANIIDISINAIDNASKVFRKVGKELSELDQMLDDLGNTIGDTPFNRFLTEASYVKEGFLELKPGIDMAIKSLKEFYEFAEEGAQISRLRDATSSLAISMGSNMDEIVLKIKQASLGTITEFDAMASASRAMMLGVSADADQLANLMEIAAARGRLMGIDATQAFDDMVRGIGRLSPEILDNLGIVIDADTRYAFYAKSIGKASDELSIADKRTALLNGVLEEGNELLAIQGGLLEDDATKMERLTTRWTDFVNMMKEVAGVATAGTIGKLTNAIDESTVSFMEEAQAIAFTSNGIADYTKRIKDLAKSHGMSVAKLYQMNLMFDEQQLKAIQLGNSLQQIGQHTYYLGGNADLLDARLKVLAEDTGLSANAITAWGDRSLAAAQKSVFGFSLIGASSKEFESASKIYKSALEDLWEKQNNLTEIQQNYSQGIGNELVSLMGTRMYNSGKRYVEGLQALDAELGTNYMAEYQHKQAIESAVNEYSRTGDVDAFREKLSILSDAELPSITESAAAAADEAARLVEMMQMLANLEGTYRFKVIYEDGSGGGPLPKSERQKIIDAVRGDRGNDNDSLVAKGGSFTVPSGYPNDSYVPPIRLTSGERVDITPYGKSKAGGGTTVVVNYSPAVALGDRYEAEAVLAPMIQRALRGMV